MLKGKKVLVTGGAGFIGSHIVDKLVDLEAEVVVLDNLITGKIENIENHIIEDRVKFIQGDITNETALERALDGVEYVSHQAALRSVPKSVDDPLNYYRVNVRGTMQLFLRATDVDSKVKRIVFASSSSVYGDRVDFPESETDVIRPLSPYASSKAAGEDLAYVFTKIYGLDIVSLRYFNVFGPRQSLENQYAVVVPKFIKCLLDGESPPIYGDGNQERDFTYVDDVVAINLLALMMDDIAGEIF